MLKNAMANPMILVTGSEGFVGSQLCRELLRRGSSVLAARRAGREGRTAEEKEISQRGTKAQETPHLHTIGLGDIGPDTDWSAALSGMDAVVHLAARVHMMKETAADPLAEFRMVNVAGTRRLAEAAAQAGVKRLVFLSSVKVNGEATGKGREPFREGDPPRPEDDYGVSKWEAEQTLRDRTTDGHRGCNHPPAIDLRAGREGELPQPDSTY